MDNGVQRVTLSQLSTSNSDRRSRIVFLGLTLWTNVGWDERCKGYPYFCKFQAITTPITCKWLAHQLRKLHGKEYVVITHHPPFHRMFTEALEY